LKGQLNVEIMGRGYAWLDTGTHDIPARCQPVHCHHGKPPRAESGLPGRNRLPPRLDQCRATEALAQPLIKNGYGQYLLRILKENMF
jgi:glucose-1-phosphate thymidylyltransferase